MGVLGENIPFEKAQKRRSPGMTVMIPTFFALHQEIVKMGIWKRLKEGAKDLYVYLMCKSERHRTRELRCKDREIREAVGVASRTLCDARKQLQELGILRCVRVEGNTYKYEICDPA